MAYTTIKKPSDYFNTKLYTGNGSTQSITGVGFQPDWCWFKCRTNTYEHQVYDVVRGVTKRLVPNDTSVEGTQTNGLSAFGADGFTVGDANGTNINGENYAAWNWLADNTSGSSNTDGSITSTVSANTTSGFSIVSYTGTGSGGTIGHGLGVAPKMIIVRCRNVAKAWTCYHSALGSSAAIFLEQTSAATTGNTTYFGGTNPTSSVFSIGTSTNVTNSGSDFIAYCFAEKQGFSKFGSYTGNGNADGTFVYTGFKPAFVLSKCTSLAGEDWNINDNKRPGYNVIQNALLANSTAAEITASYQAIDTLSNGFKWRGDNSRVNGSGATYIYMAFAEEPLVGDNPATAR